MFPIIWLGFLFYLINNSYPVLNAIFSSFLQLGNLAAGGVDLQPGNIMWNGIALQNNMVKAYNDATGAVSYTHLDVYKRQAYHLDHPSAFLG